MEEERTRRENWSVWKGLLARQAGEGDDLGRLGRLRLLGAGGSPPLPTKDEGWQQLPLYGGGGGRRWCPAMPDSCLSFLK